MFAIDKLNRQNEQTWVNLQKRLNLVQFDYKRLFPTEVHNFVKNKAVSVGSSEGYFIPSLLTTTAFVLASNNIKVDTSTHKQPLNIFTIFVGYPGTGKSSAIQYAAQEPLEFLSQVVPLSARPRLQDSSSFLPTTKKGSFYRLKYSIF
ncbi:hypothetical protein OS493_031862 [Desmophyllum pertusum]|uniref:Uncharacterized protein n=1 Tax=Desmophyllum pertusum TaxID=174260 RepID=A0A9W9Y8A8_9CNID|nr:hypothetical protein OS493_031862 [Desmophyllum pertusum]